MKDLWERLFRPAKNSDASRALEAAPFAQVKPPLTYNRKQRAARRRRRAGIADPVHARLQAIEAEKARILDEQLTTASSRRLDALDAEADAIWESLKP